MKPKMHLVTRADDAGSCRSANEAILECVEAGIIKNVSFMAVGPELGHAIELLGGRDDIAYGFHVCLNSEWQEVKWGPLTERPVLVDAQGHLLPFPHNTQAAIERETKAAYTLGGLYYPEPADVEAEIEYEIQAQWERLQALGLKISYIDEHMGISRTVPSARPRIDSLCRRHELVDAHYVPYLPTVDTTRDSFAALEARLKAATGDRYVWVTHPGKAAPDMNRFFLEGWHPGIVARERDAERRLLCDPPLLELLARRKVKPVRYDELPHR